MTTVPNLNVIPAVTSDDLLISHDTTTNRTGRVSATAVKDYVVSEIKTNNELDAEDISYSTGTVKDRLDNTIRVVNSFSALATTSGSVGDEVYLKGANGGLFRAESSAGKVTDTGSVSVNGAIAWVRKVFHVSQFGAVTNGTDTTAAINACILAAYKAKQVVIAPTDEVYSVEVEFDGGKDYHVYGTILLPSGIVLNGKGCRLVGNFPSANNTLYNNAAVSTIETATYNAGTGQFQSNRSAGVATSRVVGAGIKNFAFLSMNCAINAINMNEECFIEHCTFNNVSAMMRLTACFYLRVEQHILRNSCHASGQPAIHLIGGNHNAMSFKHVALAGPSIGFKINGPASFASSIQVCTFEEGKADGSIGILFDSDAYCAGWDISTNYIEGVKYGFYFVNGCGVYGGQWATNIFNNNEYSFYGPSAQNALRMVEFKGNSIPDDGGVNRNLIELGATGNDIIHHIPAKSSNTTNGIVQFLANHTPSNSFTANSTSVWRRVSDGQAIGKSLPGTANQNHLNPLPFEGANIVTVPNEVPFCNAPIIAATTAILDTNINYDVSNMLVFNFQLNDFIGSYILHGEVFGTTVYRRDLTPVTMTVSNNAGKVRVTFGNINTNAGTSLVLSGNIRHY